MARQRLPSLNARIRTRRTQLGLTGAELSQRADISPSYVSLIEKGAKVPDEDVAARLAKALRDDEDLYRAWARASRLGLHRINLLNRMEAISRSPAYVSMVERGEALPALLARQADPKTRLGAFAESPSGMFAMSDRKPSRAAGERPAPRQAPLLAPEPDATGAAPPPLAGQEESPEILRIPVLADGADPGRTVPSPLAVRDRLLVDRRLVADHSAERLFAYEVTDRICAVRTREGIVLSRVLFKGRSLLLLPGEGEGEFATVDVAGVKALPGMIAGTHVLLIRR
jgi:DNA-binding XRE family transcriptional regulator